MVNNYSRNVENLCDLMNLPKGLRYATREKIPPTLLHTIDKFKDSAEENIRKGIGFVLSGPSGIGKSSAAVYLAKFLKTTSRTDKKYFTCYFINAGDLKDKFKAKEMWNEDVSIYDHCRKVDFLILDELSKKEGESSWPGPNFFTDLLSLRSQDGLSTVITTNLPKAQLAECFPEFPKVSLGQLLFVPVTGVNYRIEKHRNLEEIFIPKGE